MKHTPAVSTPMDPNGKLDLVEDRRDKELDNITDYQAVVPSVMHAALATTPDISYTVAALSHYISRPFTRYMSAAKGVLQYVKTTAHFGLHFTGNGIGIGIGIDIGNSLIRYLDSDWANDSADCRSQ